MLIIYGKRLPQTVVTSFANLYYYGLFYFVSARQSISLSCVMFMFATEEMKMDSMPSGKCAFICSISYSSSKSHLVIARKRSLSNS